MANKAIIDIDIDDSRFKEFYKLFKEYEADVENQPKAWSALSDKMSGTAEAFTAATAVLVESLAASSASAKELAKHMSAASEAQKQFGSATREGESGLKKMAKEAKELGEHIFGIGKFLFKMGAVGVGAAAGSIYGVDKLAQSAVASQRSARGLGLTTGQYRAFSTDLGRYTDESTLAKIADAQNSPAGAIYLSQALGLSPQQIQTMDAGSLAARLAIVEHNKFANATPDQRQFLALQPGFAQLGIGNEDFRRSGAASIGELTRAQSQYAAHSQQFNYTDKAVDALYVFANQLKAAGQGIETTLTKKMSQLSPALGSLVDTLGKDASLLINQVFSKENVEAISQGIDTFTHYLGSQEFKEDVKTFVDDLGVLMHGIEAAAKWIKDNFLPQGSGGSGTPGGNPWANPENNGGDTWVNKALHPGNYSNQRSHGLGFIPYDKAVYQGPYYENINPETQKGRTNLSYLSGLEKTLGLPGGLLSATAQVESSGNPNATSNKGAMGAFQLMPGVAKALGVSNPYDFNQSASGASRLYSQLSTRYKGDLRKTLAAYNWNPTSLDTDIAAHGSDWERYAPQETQNQINKIVSIMAKNNKANNVNITLTNKTGTNVAMSANAAGM